MLSTSLRTIITEVVDPNRVPLYLREADQIRPVPYPSSVQKKTLPASSNETGANSQAKPDLRGP